MTDSRSSKGPGGTGLRGQVALITGAGRARGMGRATALALAAASADVVVTDIGVSRVELDTGGVGVGNNPEELEETAPLSGPWGVGRLRCLSM